MTENNQSFPKFTGHSRLTIDQKSRVSLPSNVRSCLPADAQSRFMLNFGREGCIEIHPMAEWKGVQMPKFSGYDEEKTEERVELLARLAYCFDVETDSAARLLIPKPLMEYVGLGPGQECVLTSGGTYLKLMRAKAFDDLVRPILKAYGGSANDEPTKNAER